MRLIILENEDDVTEWAAKYVAKRINDHNRGNESNKNFVLGLPTGGTPTKMYRKLAEFYREGKVSFKNVSTFNMDEYVNIPESHKESYHYYMFNNLFKHVDLEPSNTHILNGNAPNLTEECERYERLISEAGGVDLFLGGIGPDGHIAFNEPGSSLVSRTRVKTLNQDTIHANARFFDHDISQVPKQALTVGVGTVMDAKEVLVLITGLHKSFALYKAVEEGVSHMWTVSAFQQHPNFTIVCDEAATAELKVKTVKYFKDLWHIHQHLNETKEAAASVTEEVEARAKARQGGEITKLVQGGSPLATNGKQH